MITYQFPAEWGLFCNNNIPDRKNDAKNSSFSHKSPPEKLTPTKKPDVDIELLFQQRLERQLEEDFDDTAW